MRTRPLVLAGSLLALAGALLLWGDALSAERYRQILIWGLPVAVGLLALAILPRPPQARARPSPLSRRWLLLGWAVAALAVAQAAVPLAFRLGWLIFTWGDQQLADSPALAVAWSLPLTIVLGVFGWEWGLRRTLFASWSARFGAAAAWAATLLCGVALALPSLLPGLVVSDRDFVLAGLVVATCREAALTLLYRHGGLGLAGAARGLLVCLDAVVINDVVSPFFPAANYVAGDPRFYALRASAAVLALAIVALGCRHARGPAALSPAGPMTDRGLA